MNPTLIRIVETAQVTRQLIKDRCLTFGEAVVQHRLDYRWLYFLCAGDNFEFDEAWKIYKERMRA